MSEIVNEESPERWPINTPKLTFYQVDQANYYRLCTECWCMTYVEVLGRHAAWHGYLDFEVTSEDS